MEPIEFSAPQYIQTKDKKPAYHFVITVKDPIIYTSEKQPELTELLTNTDSVEFLKNFTTVFASTCSKYFPKPLIAERLIGKLSHIIKTIDDTHHGDGIVCWYFIPLSMCVSGITMEVNWKLIKTTSVIRWEEEEEEVAVQAPVEEEVVNEVIPSTSKEVTDTLEEVTDVSQNITGDEKPEFILGPSAAAKEKEKKRLREAKLQVELARFRAARAYEKYVAKYGDDLSDSETEGEESEYE